MRYTLAWPVKAGLRRGFSSQTKGLLLFLEKLSKKVRSKSELFCYSVPDRDVWYYFSKMKLLILYRPNSEHARAVETFIHDFESRHVPPAKVEVLSLDTRDGAATASLYDVVQYPAMLATTTDGSVTRMWEGQTLPLMSEVAGSLL